MESNARCWTLPVAVPLMAMLWLTGCGVGGFDTGSTCPSVVEYSPNEQSRAANEIRTLSEGMVVIRMLSDYAVLRDQARVCL